MADLLTLDELKTALDITDSTQDAKLTQLIEDVSDVIRSHCNRDFATDTAPSTRTYTYDGKGFLDVNDLVPGSVTAVAIRGVPLAPEMWLEQPVGEDVTTWLELPPANGVDLEMGFTRSLDKYGWFYASTPATVTVTATFGWPDIPRAVRRAAIWTAQDWLDNPDTDIQESIDGYSHTRTPDSSDDAIPMRAQTILERYIRTSL